MMTLLLCHTIESDKDDRPSWSSNRAWSQDRNCFQMSRSTHIQGLQLIRSTDLARQVSSKTRTLWFLERHGTKTSKFMSVKSKGSFQANLSLSIRTFGHCWFCKSNCNMTFIFHGNLRWEPYYVNPTVA